MAVEKRRERRIKVNLPIKIIYKGSEIVNKTENISRLGAYVEIDKETPVDIDVDIILEIPAYTQDSSLIGELRCRGNIFRCNPAGESESKKYYGIGIFFTEFLTPADKEKLSKYIDFFVLKETQEIQERIKQHRQRQLKKTSPSGQTHTKEYQYHLETMDLLKQILNRLEDISRQLQAKK